jgi:ferrous iron transport protein A
MTAIASSMPAASIEPHSVAHMKARSSATIHALVEPAAHTGHSGVAQRLTELGFFPGEAVTVLRRGPGGREPIAVQIGETLFALRNIEAACIQVIEHTTEERA